jgi:hypothetical protein
MCDLKRCKEPVSLIYYSHDICEKHWQLHCAKKIDLKTMLKVMDGPRQLTLK